MQTPYPCPCPARHLPSPCLWMEMPWMHHIYQMVHLSLMDQPLMEVRSKHQRSVHCQQQVYKQQLGLLRDWKPIFSSLFPFPWTGIITQSTGMWSQMVLLCGPLNGLMAFWHNQRKTWGWRLLQVKVQLQQFRERLVSRFRCTWYLMGCISICRWAEGSM